MGEKAETSSGTRLPMCSVLLGFMSGRMGGNTSAGLPPHSPFQPSHKVGTEPGFRTFESFDPKRRSESGYLSTGWYHSLSQEALTIEWPDEAQAGGCTRPGSCEETWFGGGELLKPPTTWPCAARGSFPGSNGTFLARKPIILFFFPC